MCLVVHLPQLLCSGSYCPGTAGIERRIYEKPGATGLMAKKTKAITPRLMIGIIAMSVLAAFGITFIILLCAGLCYISIP